MSLASAVGRLAARVLQEPPWRRPSWVARRVPSPHMSLDHPGSDYSSAPAWLRAPRGPHSKSLAKGFERHVPSPVTVQPLPARFRRNRTRARSGEQGGGLLSAV